MEATEDKAQDKKERTVTVVINGQPFETDQHELTYDAVVAFAFPDRSSDLEYTVTYRKADGSKHEGTLAPGTSVKIKKGTVFNVTPTTKS